MICTICKESKEELEFYFRAGVGSKRRAECKLCFNKRHRSYYDKNKLKCIQDINKRRAVKFAHIINYLKIHPCVDCGESDPVVLQFDHIKGIKKFNVSEGTCRPLSSLISEMEKCEIRCANCHLRATAKRGNWRKFRFTSV